MAGLQRSEVSFRRVGSSGLIWDDKLLSGELKKISTKGEEDSQAHVETKEAKPSHGGGNVYRAVNIEPAADPPSPRVSGCGVCGGMFGKKQPAGKSQKRKHAGGHRKS